MEFACFCFLSLSLCVSCPQIWQNIVFCHLFIYHVTARSKIFDCLSFFFYNNQKYLLIRNSHLDTKHIRLKYNF